MQCRIPRLKVPCLQWQSDIRTLARLQVQTVKCPQLSRGLSSYGWKSDVQLNSFGAGHRTRIAQKEARLVLGNDQRGVTEFRERESVSCAANTVG